MKIYISIILGLLFHTQLFSNSTLVNELIRHKIENLPVFQTLNNKYEIYCIPSVREVYLANNFDPFWEDETKIEELISVLKSSLEEGLNPKDYHLPYIKKLKAMSSIEERANLDIILSDALMLYISHILAGKVNPVTINAEWHVLKTDKNPLKYFYQMDSIPIRNIIQNISPKISYYKALKVELHHYRELAAKQQPAVIPIGQILKPGTRDSRIIQIRQMLAFYEDDTLDNNLNSDYYDDTLKLAIIDFQKKNGLEALGTIGNQTIEVLNFPVMKKIQSIELNLERLRWLPQELPNYYLIVNIANFELEVIENNITIRKHKVIVGKPFRATPVFSSTMQYLVFNPSWTVPPTIIKEDLIPELRKNTQYLANKNIFVYDNQGKRLNADSIDWNSNKVYSYTYRQEPGKNNALGAVKFMFPNKYSIYLHDTPSKELFERTERAFSSGCIRVQQPLDLAAYLLREQSNFSIKEIKKIVETAKTQTIFLKSKPEVFLLYLTSWVDENGEFNFRKDIYERDKKLFIALSEKPVFDIEYK